MKAGYIVAGILVALSVAIWWTKSHEEYRKQTLAKVAEYNRQWEDAKLAKLTWRANPVPAGDVFSPVWAAAVDARNEEAQKIETRALDIAQSFLLFEKSVKEQNGGELPAWLKDDRNWRELDKEIQP